MIPNITAKHSDFRKLVEYLVRVDRDRGLAESKGLNPHVDPHLVAGHETVMFGRDSSQILGRADGRKLAAILDEPWQAFGRPGDPGHVFHCSLSLAAMEGKIGDERWKAVAEDYMRGMGFIGGAKADCRWLAIHHGPSRTGGADHIHIALSLVREDGTRASTWRDWPRSQAVCRELERKHGLLELQNTERGRVTRGVSRAELDRQRRSGAERPERVELAVTIRGAAQAASSEAEFTGRLREAGLRPRPWYARGSGTSVVGGYSVRAPGDKTPWIGGGRVASDLSLPALRRHYGWQPDEASVEAWRTAALTPWAARREAAAHEWEAGQAEVGRLREYLARPDLSAAEWAAGARDLAGVFATGAVAAGREDGRALWDAAHALSKSATVRPSEVQARPEGMPNLRGVALLAASAARGGQGSLAELAMWQQVMNAAKAVHDMHRAVEDARRAQEIAEVMRGRLRAMTAPVREGAGAQPTAPTPSVPDAALPAVGDRAAEEAAKLARAGGIAPTAPARPRIAPRAPAIDRESIPKRQPEVARAAQEERTVRLSR